MIKAVRDESLVAIPYLKGIISTRKPDECIKSEYLEVAIPYLKGIISTLPLKGLIFNTLKSQESLNLTFNLGNP